MWYVIVGIACGLAGYIVGYIHGDCAGMRRSIDLIRLPEIDPWKKKERRGGKV